jgi:branched-chain amino acid transport system ATP-binding protein
MSEPLLVAEGVTAGYGPVTVLREVTLVAREGELVTVLGANGSGKSTLLSAIVGLLAPRAGRVTFAGQDITGRSAESIARQRLVMVPEGRQLFGPMSVLDNLLLGAHCRRRSRRATAETLERVFSLFPVLQERPRLPAASLSGGQQQMLAIGRALAANPGLILLDEPLEGLAPSVALTVEDAILTLKERGTTMLLVEHNSEMALRVADRGSILELGKVVATGTAAELSADASLVHRYLAV